MSFLNKFKRNDRRKDYGALTNTAGQDTGVSPEERFGLFTRRSPPEEGAISELIDKKSFGASGGIGPEFQSPRDIDKIDRFREPPTSGIKCDLLWSQPDFERDYSGDGYFVSNDIRGYSYYYSYDAAVRFLEANDLLFIITASVKQNAGYRMYPNTNSGLPLVMVVCSLPIYLDFYGNKGAIICLDEAFVNVKRFVESPHPYYLPNFMNVFDWLVPYVVNKVVNMFSKILKEIKIQGPDWDPIKPSIGSSEKIITTDKGSETETANRSLQAATADTPGSPTSGFNIESVDPTIFETRFRAVFSKNSRLRRESPDLIQVLLSLSAAERTSSSGSS